MHATPNYLYALVGVLCLIVGLLFGLLFKGRTLIVDSDPIDSTLPKEEKRASDPWEMQEMLMRASDQPMAAFPALTSTTLLYAALMAEELAETYAGLEKALAARFQSLGLDDAQFSNLEQIVWRLQSMSAMLSHDSNKIRVLLSTLPELSLELDEEEAVELLDGSTDVAVVNCGFALASGLPGREGYEEVLGSNLSKRNPATGKIDKDPSGKWIKGADYRKPDLAFVLYRIQQARELAQGLYESPTHVHAHAHAVEGCAKP